MRVPTLCFVGAIGLWIWSCGCFADDLTQNTQGACSPTIANVRGGVVVTCNLSIPGLKENAEANLQKALSELRMLMYTQSVYLIPGVLEYLDDPTIQNWQVVRGEVQRTQIRLGAAIDSVIKYDANLEPATGSNLALLHQALRGRSFRLLGLPTEPPDKKVVSQWIQQYRLLMENLKREVEVLQKTISASRKTSQ